MEAKKIIKTLSGKITSTSMANTIVVSVETKKRHPLLEKVYSTFKKYKVHTADVSRFSVGDIVSIVPCRPVSKYKRFIVQGEELSSGSTFVKSETLQSEKPTTASTKATKAKKMTAKKATKASASKESAKKVKKSK